MLWAVSASKIDFEVRQKIPPEEVMAFIYIVATDGADLARYVPYGNAGVAVEDRELQLLTWTPYFYPACIV